MKCEKEIFKCYRFTRNENVLYSLTLNSEGIKLQVQPTEGLKRYFKKFLHTPTSLGKCYQIFFGSISIDLYSSEVIFNCTYKFTCICGSSYTAGTKTMGSTRLFEQARREVHCSNVKLLIIMNSGLKVNSANLFKNINYQCIPLYSTGQGLI